jgi:hypothetical protein
MRGAIPSLSQYAFMAWSSVTSTSRVDLLSNKKTIQNCFSVCLVTVLKLHPQSAHSIQILDTCHPIIFSEFFFTRNQQFKNSTTLLERAVLFHNNITIKQTEKVNPKISRDAFSATTNDNPCKWWHRVWGKCKGENVPVFNWAPYHEDTLKEWRYSSTYSWPWH